MNLKQLKEIQHQGITVKDTAKALVKLNNGRMSLEEAYEKLRQKLTEIIDEEKLNSLTNPEKRFIFPNKHHEQTRKAREDPGGRR